ncbi:MAG: hypothetical protein R2881_08710 [Eubacteriales bacterium]
MSASSTAFAPAAQIGLPPKVVAWVPAESVLAQLAAAGKQAAERQPRGDAFAT